MNTETYYHTRSEMLVEELRPYDGKWVAFSADGTHIVAAAENLTKLDEMVIAAGEDPELVGFERIELEDESTGGAELS